MVLVSLSLCGHYASCRTTLKLENDKLRRQMSEVSQSISQSSVSHQSVISQSSVSHQSVISRSVCRLECSVVNYPYVDYVSDPAQE